MLNKNKVKSIYQIKQRHKGKLVKERQGKYNVEAVKTTTRVSLLWSRLAAPTPDVTKLKGKVVQQGQMATCTSHRAVRPGLLSELFEGTHTIIALSAQRLNLSLNCR